MGQWGNMLPLSKEGGDNTMFLSFSHFWGQKSWKQLRFGFGHGSEITLFCLSVLNAIPTPFRSTAKYTKPLPLPPPPHTRTFRSTPKACLLPFPRLCTVSLKFLVLNLKWSEGGGSFKCQFLC